MGRKILRSVANLTRKDGEEFLNIAPVIPVETEIKTYPLHQANNALNDLGMETYMVLLFS
jgi:propanol-preferring alcohol dehydrogenase